MTSGDLKFKVRYVKVKRVLPRSKLNIRAKFEGSNDKTVTCIVVTSSDNPILESKWPLVTSNLKRGMSKLKGFYFYSR